MIALCKILNSEKKVIGLECYNESSNKVFISKQDFQKYEFDNIKITLDNKIKGSLEEKIYSNKVYKLYHASHNGIKGNIAYNVSRVECDFGQGFYTGDKEIQPKMLVSESINNIVYELLVDLDDLNVYRFKQAELWAIYVGINRGMIKIPTNSKLYSELISINSKDIIIGPIADDRMAYAFQLFIEGSIASVALEKCLSHVELGNQFVFKTQKACNKILITKSYSMNADELKKYKKLRSKFAGKASESTNEIIKLYRRSGAYIDELIERYS